MVAEYLDRFKHYPPDRMSWHEFAALVDRTGRYQARERLAQADAFMIGQPAQDGSELALKSMHKAALERIAWPRGG